MCTCDHYSKWTIWKWSLNLKVGRKRSSSLDYYYSKRYKHELKVTTSTIQYSQGPWYNTVQCSAKYMPSIPLKHGHGPVPPHTYKERASEASSLLVYIYPRNELASLAHSFYSCLKHQLSHLTIVLFRSIYLGSIVVS